MEYVPKYEIDKHPDYGYIIWERDTDLYLSPNFKTWEEAYKFMISIQIKELV